MKRANDSDQSVGQLSPGPIFFREVCDEAGKTMIDNYRE